jgi:hypothetical protein
MYREMAQRLGAGALDDNADTEAGLEAASGREVPS